MTSEFAYSLRVKNGAGWRAFDRIRLLISVGKEYHEGKKLVAIVDWINRNASIKEVHVSVNDLLQRHNLVAEGFSEKEAETRSMAEGALWLTRNQDILAEIRTRSHISRWQDWFGRTAFDDVLGALKQHRKENKLFEEALSKDSRTLATRRTLRGEDVPSKLIDHSRDYVLEELAVFAMQSQEMPAAEVYPGSNLHSAEYFIANFAEEKSQLPDTIQSLASRHFTRVDFSRINLQSAVPKGEARILRA